MKVSNHLWLEMALGSSWLYSSLQHRLKESQACFHALNPVLAFVACLTHELGQMGRAQLPTFPWPGICTAMKLESKDAGLCG